MKLLITSIVLLGLATSAFAENWRQLSPGIEYRDSGASLLSPWSHIHTFRINLQKNKLDLVMANNLSLRHASVHEFARHSKALITLNGGFFDNNHHPLGLRIGHQQQQNPLKRISWWGVFYIKNKKPTIASSHQYEQDQQIDFALQSGPRLLVNGKIPALKPGLAERSALGITANNEVIIIVTENTPMTTTALAEMMQSSPLDCKEGLNLDGGSSSQLKAEIGSFQINVHSFANVSDAIVVKPRNPVP